MSVQVTVDNQKSNIEAANVLSWIHQDFIISLDTSGPVETYLSDDTEIRKAKWKVLKHEHMRDDFEKSSRYVSNPFEKLTYVKYIESLQMAIGTRRVTTS